jgi:glycosyltransferase involved in cell wall biosynthesis
MHSPKFSVIIPAYNQAEFLSEAIVSVLNQTCRDFEVIIVNDASPDQTNEIVKRFIDPRITLLVHPENRGASATRNTGIRASSGEYIAFLDADDYFHPNKLQVHMDYIAVNPDVSATYNSHYELNHSQKTIRGLWRPPKNLSMADFVVGFPFAPSDVLIRRDWLDKVGLFDESYRFYGDDLDMNCKLALAGCKFGIVDLAARFDLRDLEKTSG